MRWSEFAQREPRLAALGHRRLVDPGVVLVGTIRRDGTPRISPVEPLVWERDLWLSMLLGSYKAADLERDPRILVHSIVTGRSGEEGEYKVRGEAIEEREDTIQRRYASEVSARLDWSPEPGRFHLFRVDIRDVTFIRYEESSGDQYVARWPSRQEFVRRGTSATSLSDAERYRDLFA